MKLSLMQKIDKILGPPICTVLTIYDKVLLLLKIKSQKNNFQLDNCRILVLKFWGMGSIILAMSVIKKVKERLPNCKIYFLTLLRNKELLEGYKHIIDGCVFLDIDKSFLKFIYDLIKILITIRKLKLSLLIDLEFFTRFSAIISYLSGVKNKAGFAAWEVWRGFLHTTTVPFNRYWHVKKNFTNLISKALKKDIDFDSKLYPPYFEFESENIKKFDFHKYISINPNAGELALERRWPYENFINLTKKILDNWDGYVVFLGTKMEKRYVEKIVLSLDSKRVKNLAGELSFKDLVLVLKNSILLITNDSGPLHLAVALDVPTISFFGPETPVLYGPLEKKHVVFFKDLDCSPCINVHTGKIVRCIKPLPECMTKISPEEVWKTIKEKIYATT
ncbi:MAG: glycosyltransferase family 9 protein [Endomicrobiia bacterium]